MTENTYLAHVAEDGRVQTVLEHLLGTAQRSAAFAASFGAGAQGELAGKFHDIGKCTPGFQRRLLENGPKVDHATAGAFECMKMLQVFAAFAVAGHHGGLPDGGGRGDGPETGTFFGRMNRAAKGRLENYDTLQGELALPQADMPAFAAKDQSAGMFFTRMLFSCLVDADYTDTGEFMDGHTRGLPDADGMDALCRRLRAYIAGWFPPKGAFNARRCAILETCLREGERRAPGLYTLTVPTGGGKTVSSLAFALTQAKARGLKRVIYVIPYTSIIEQTARVFREILGENNVLEHHSGVTFELKENEASTPETERFTRSVETWDAPVVVTTAVQFFESLFSSKPSQCRKLHNIARSVIIFDEAQMLPLPYLRPCVWAITQLVRHYQALVELHDTLDDMVEFYEGVVDYTDAVGEAAEGAHELLDGTGELVDGVGELKDGVLELQDGAQQLYDGCVELSDGLTEFNEEAIQKILDALDGDLADLADRAEAMFDMVKAYNSYAGIADGMTGKVQFLINTSGI